MDRQRKRASAVFDHINTIEEICADFVHFIDKNDTRHRITVCLTPYSFGLWLYTGIGVKNTHSTIKNRQRTLNLNGEVNVAGRVDDIETKLCRIRIIAKLG